MALHNYLPHITGKEAAKYVLLPGIIPRIRALGGSGFGYFAFLIATIYRAVRILPAGHPYTLPGNMGTFGLRDVVSEAANHVTLSWRTADQVIIYFAILSAIVILFLQFAALILLLFSGQAFASSLGSPDDYSFFSTEFPQKDIAFLMLDHVFGIPNFFNSDAPTGTPFHVALQTLFQFYNVAILIVAVLIFLYYVIVVVVETAQTGTPFGQRFNSVYAPIRLVVALGLLIPLNYGLNTAQYITLYAAKIGSGFATNGWLRFNESLENPLGARPKELIADPVVPEIDNLVQFFAVIHTCKIAYETKQPNAIDKIDGYIIANGKAHSWSTGGTDEHGGTSDPMGYSDAVKLTNGNNIRVVFGHLNEEWYPNSPGNVFPFCGAVTIPVTAPDPELTGDTPLSQISFVYWYLAQGLWQDAGGAKIKPMAEKIVKAMSPSNGAATTKYKPSETERQAVISAHQTRLEASIKGIFKRAREQTDFSLSKDVKRRGWGGAGIWYNKLAEVNGVYQSAVYNIPYASAFPTVVETVIEQKRAASAGSGKCDLFKPTLADDEPVKFERAGYDQFYARVMYHMHSAWTCDTDDQSTTNIFWDAMHMIFGVKGLFDMRCNNKDQVHPLAQLTSIGKGLIDSSVRNLATAMGAAALGGISKALPNFGGDLSAMGQAASQFFLSMATIGLSIGFLLFYILPFMPFLYFFFAVGAWVKGIFEAMVGAPLWALAHLKIEGEGLPGKSAINGYYLIFEVFVRPILIVAGLIGGMVIFSAAVTILNDIFDTAVYRLTGIDIDAANICTADTEAPPQETARADESEDMLDKHILDEFFFTVIYAIFVYMIAMSCFKMIDLVPNGILRFMGSSTTPFADESGDPTEGLGQYAALGGATVGGKVMGGLTQASSAGGLSVGGIGDMANKMSKEGQQ